MMLTTISDENRMQCFGKNGSVKRNGKMIQLISSEEIDKASAVAIKDPSKAEEARKLREKNPKIEDGDIIISGKDTIISLVFGGSRKKEADLEDGVGEKTIYLLENSELKASGVKHFEKEDKKKDTKYIIESVKTLEFLKGSFQILSIGGGEEIETSFGAVKFHGKGASGFFDITSEGLYTFPQLGPERKLEYICKRTKKSYMTKDYKSSDPVFPTEIVITNSGIYKVPFTQADNPNLIKLTTIMMSAMKPSQELSLNAIPQQQKMMENMASGEFQNQIFSGMEMMKNMTPEDLKRLVKKGGGSISSEQMKMFEQVPEMIKKMESSGKMAEMKKGFAQAGNMLSGMSKENMALFSKQQERNVQKFNIESDKILEEFKKAKKEPYKPLKAEYKVA